MDLQGNLIHSSGHPVDMVICIDLTDFLYELYRLVSKVRICIFIPLVEVPQLSGHKDHKYLRNNP